MPQVLKILLGFIAPVGGWLLVFYGPWQYIFLFYWFVLLCPLAILISSREIFMNAAAPRGNGTFPPKNFWLADLLLIVALMLTQLVTFFSIYVLGPT